MFQIRIEFIFILEHFCLNFQKKLAVCMYVISEMGLIEWDKNYKSKNFIG